MKKRVMNIAMVAHDNRKEDLLSWLGTHLAEFKEHNLFATGTTGGMICERYGLSNVTKLKSGPLGGDQELGAMIANGQIDAIFFLWDPMMPQPHEPDVRALLRISVLKNIIIAESRQTADMVITSPLFANADYTPIKTDYSKYLKRTL